MRDAKVLVTGAASGIGRATALAAAADGAELVLTDINAEGLDATVTDIRAAGGRVALAEALDITDYDAVRGFADRVHAELGSLDVVMNIAGTSVWGPWRTWSTSTGGAWWRST
jgi:NAD(P)-dependent dehydrogenase (short-subunit alcohol dehydrogenase family)